jgi:TrmH family RNA methyltransferase
LQSDRGDRQSEALFVVEGLTLVREALEHGASIEEVFYTEKCSQDPQCAVLLNALTRKDIEIVTVTDEVMRGMADTRTPQGILAVTRWVELALPEAPTFALIVDGIHDPGNMGTIMRLAAGAAVPVMLVMPGTVDIYNPKVVRSAMGAHFAVPTVSASWDEIGRHLPSHTLFLADSDQGQPHFEVNWVQPCALIVSDEANGASPDALRLAQTHVTIPMPGKTESLNVAMAAGILIYEMIRQRLQAEPRGGERS